MSEQARTGPVERPLGAGEGGRLPRGLSLFRFVLFSSLMLGACYGGASLYFDAPPPAGTPAAAAWSPSPLWLPAFLSLHAGLGITKTSAGYAFAGRGGSALFAGTTLVWGLLLGGAAGWWGGERVRQYVVRRR